VLKLIKDNFHPGDKLVETGLSGDGSGDVEAQAFVTAEGHRLLLANKRDHAVEIKLTDEGSASALIVDTSNGDEPARKEQVRAGVIKLEPFAVAVVSW
jgi:hypothetical protein